VVPEPTVNILFTATYFYPYLSGLTDYPLKIASYLAKKHQVTVLTFQHQKSLPLKENYQGITICRLPVHWQLFKGLWNWFYPFIALIEIFKTDAVFINLPQFEGFLAAIYGRLLRKKVYVIYHCDLYFSGHSTSQWLAKIANVTAWISCFFCHKIIIYTKDYAQNSKVLKSFLSKVSPIYPPVLEYQSDQQYYTQLKKMAQGNPVVGFSGRIAREKGLEYLLEAMVVLQKKYPSARLLLAGPFGQAVVGESEYYLRIKKLIKDKKIKADYLGSLNKNQLFAFYQLIDLLVLPSINKTEAFGMVQVEAMFCAKPVVATNLPGVRIPIQVTGMGKVIQPADSKALAEAIELVYQQPNNYQKKSDLAKTVFDAKKTFAFFDSLLPHET
jgi:glycosyltransferase involved in cell wall biosynthesis